MGLYVSSENKAKEDKERRVKDEHLRNQIPCSRSRAPFDAQLSSHVAETEDSSRTRRTVVHFGCN